MRWIGGWAVTNLKATSAYRDRLTLCQLGTLERFFAADVGRQFFLTGGTALAAFYLQHRQSANLDLYTLDDLALREASLLVPELAADQVEALSEAWRKTRTIKRKEVRFLNRPIVLADEPDVLIADEPTTALDVTIQAQILDLLRNLRTHTNTSIILITHDLGIVAEMCDRVAVMYVGKIVEIAGQAAVLVREADPALADAFVRSRLADGHGGVLGTLPAGLDVAGVLAAAPIR